MRELELNQGSLKESEKRRRTLLDFAPYPVATFTLKGEISYLNPAFTEIFGRTLEEVRSGKATFDPPQYFGRAVKLFLYHMEVFSGSKVIIRKESIHGSEKSRIPI